MGRPAREERKRMQSCSENGIQVFSCLPTLLYLVDVTGIGVKSKKDRGGKEASPKKCGESQNENFRRMNIRMLDLLT
jgi:hypothetical protein